MTIALGREKEGEYRENLHKIANVSVNFMYILYDRTTICTQCSFKYNCVLDVLNLGGNGDDHYCHCLFHGIKCVRHQGMVMLTIHLRTDWFLTW